MRQVAGVYRRFGLAALQINAHGDFVFIHHRLPLLFGVTFGAASVFGHQHVAQPHPDSVDIQIGNARITDGGQQAAEVGVAGGKSGFDQRGTGNGISDLARLFPVGGAFHADGDEFAGTFAVAHDGLRQFQRDAAEQFFQLAVTRVGGIVDFHLATFARGHDDEAVVGAGVAVDGDGIERGIGDFLRQELQHGLRYFGVGGDKGQHGGHVRMNHARTLGDAGGADRVFLTDFPLAAGGLGHGVGGHNRAGGVAPVYGFDIGQRTDDFLNGQRLQYHAGRKR